MNWVLMRLQAKAEHANACQHVMYNAGALATTILNANLDSDCPYNQWREVIIEALFDNYQDDSKLSELQLLPDNLFANLKLSYVADDLIEKNNQVIAQCIANKLWVLPYHDTMQTSLPKFYLNANQSFGNGLHPTTQLCLQWLVANCTKNPKVKVLDYGCGSGILALASACLGVKHVVAVDCDKYACVCARDNIKYNNFSIECYNSAAIPSDFTAEWIVVNMLLQEVEPHIVDFARWQNTGDYLILSGFLYDQLTKAQQLISPYYNIVAVQKHESWGLIHACKQAH